MTADRMEVENKSQNTYLIKMSTYTCTILSWACGDYHVRKILVLITTTETKIVSHLKSKS